MTADGDRSVTTALINSKLDMILGEIREIKDEVRGHEERIRGVEQCQARNSERLGLVGALNLIVAGIAAWIGSRR